MTNDLILQAGGQWLAFQNPVDVLATTRADEVMDVLRQVETAVTQHNLYAAGFITYEAAAAFNLPIHPAPDGLPLLWFGLYQQPIVNCQSAIDHYQLGQWQPSVQWTDYEAAIARIKAEIAAGNTYQVNYTYNLRADFEGDPRRLFADLAAAQQAEYAAFLDIGRYAICSASPELFFRLDGDVLTSKPMKGTAVRGRTLVEDKTNMAWLHHSEKNRAENVMIVDMIRNDMGRVAQIGSVHVPELFVVERYPTVLQMTSTVTARTRAPLTDILAAMFPCASITGAPKVRTMRIINELEPEPRGVYTGAIGYIAPNRQAQFNVAIRTVVVDREQETAVYGVGGGIVWDSDAAEEYEECRIKAQVLAVKRPSFSLLESLLWTPEEGYFLLEAHLRRLCESAEYFGIGVGETAVRQMLETGDWRLEIDQLPVSSLQSPQKVRLLVAQNGEITVQVVPLNRGARPQPLRVKLATEAVDSGNIWLYHKTTRREVYESVRAARPDCDEVILWNERGEITEALTSNVVVELDGQLWTPPVSSGLLAGTFRGQLLVQDQIQERVITIEEFQRSSTIWLINSVRGWQTAVFAQ
ncbi:MAG: aminodeoxychorismate synthase component I [Ardenticatenaceae bacterium]|nr:aminodeoxychorismate synthase component I [Ardenticatenaceae bacterium]MCB9443824.1 aminodeoxychorismate synthase component I [Ardenticatenaceae bacterium]